MFYTCQILCTPRGKSINSKQPSNFLGAFIQNNRFILSFAFYLILALQINFITKEFFPVFFFFLYEQEPQSPLPVLHVEV
jgi:hypothetical protein